MTQFVKTKLSPSGKTRYVKYSEHSAGDILIHAGELVEVGQRENYNKDGMEPFYVFREIESGEMVQLGSAKDLNDLMSAAKLRDVFEIVFTGKHKRRNAATGKPYQIMTFEVSRLSAE